MRIQNGYELVINGQGSTFLPLPDGSLAISGPPGGATSLRTPSGALIPAPVTDPGFSMVVEQPPASLIVLVDSHTISALFWALREANTWPLVIRSLPAPLTLSTNSFFWRGAAAGLSKYPNLNMTMSFSPAFTVRWQSFLGASGRWLTLLFFVCSLVAVCDHQLFTCRIRARQCGHVHCVAIVAFDCQW